MLTRMWADAQRDGRTAEYRWRPLRKFCKSIPCTMPQSFGWGPLLGCHAVTLPIYENARLGRKVNFARGKILSRSKSTRPGDDQRSCKVWLTSGEWRHCSNEAQMQNRLKFAGVPQTGKLISVICGPKFAILWGHLEEILLFNKFFSDCRYMP